MKSTLRRPGPGGGADGANIAASVGSGPAISNQGVVYWGNGYGRFGLGTPSTTFYAFSLNGK